MQGDYYPATDRYYICFFIFVVIKIVSGIEPEANRRSNIFRGSP
nr:MAG TPA: hypothetical protein [Caudoviricetes sp.]